MASPSYGLPFYGTFGEEEAAGSVKTSRSIRLLFAVPVLLVVGVTLVLLGGDVGSSPAPEVSASHSISHHRMNAAVVNAEARLLVEEETPDAPSPQLQEPKAAQSLSAKTENDSVAAPAVASKLNSEKPVSDAVVAPMGASELASAASSSSSSAASSALASGSSSVDPAVEAAREAKLEAKEKKWKDAAKAALAAQPSVLTDEEACKNAQHRLAIATEDLLLAESGDGDGGQGNMAQATDAQLHAVHEVTRACNGNGPGALPQTITVPPTTSAKATTAAAVPTPSAAPTTSAAPTATAAAKAAKPQQLADDDDVDWVVPY